MRRSFWLLCVALSPAVYACGAAISPGQQVLERARDMNTAARFGRLDLAALSTDPKTRDEFLKRRSSWGQEIRVLDVDVDNITVQDNLHVDARVQVAWTRMGDGLLHNTTVTQHWTNEHEGKWSLVSESSKGEQGLFGEPSEASAPAPRSDVHFATRSLGALR
jgi:hypothetical protein